MLPPIARLMHPVLRHLPAFLAYRLYHSFLIPLEGTDFELSQIRALHGSARIDVSLRDVSDARFAFFGCDEWAGLTLCRLLGFEGQTVFEVGANCGTETLSLAALVGPTGNVIAIEPGNDMMDVLASRVRSNQLDQVTLLQSAVGEKPGRGELVKGPDENTGMSFMQAADDLEDGSVEITTLDALAEKYGRPGLVWMDIEGFELKALRGGKKTLNEYRPIIYTEVDRDHFERAGDSLEEFSEFVKACDYVPFDPWKRSLPAIDTNRLPAGYYHTNWVLIPSELTDVVKSIRWRFLAARLLPRL